MAPHILVIDDQINLPRFIAIELDAKGYQVSVQADNVMDLSTIQALNPDLIVLNWELRSASASKLCRQLSVCDRPIPVIAVTAKDEISCQLALSMGAQACLTKPFSINELLDTIERHLKQENQRAKCIH